MDWRGAFASRDDQRAETAARALVAQGPTAISLVLPLFYDPDEDVRWWAVRVLGALKEPESGELLAEALSDSSLEVQQCAAIALRQIPCQTAIPALLVLLGHPDSLLSRLAGDALIAVGKPAVPGLIALLQNGDLVNRQQAARCLAKIGDPDAIPALFNALDDQSALVSFYADEGLDRLGVGMAFFLP